MAAVISVIIPVYNSAWAITPLHDRLCRVLSQLSAEYEIILVDDGSTDQSMSVIHQLRERDPHLKVIQLAGNFGQQNAIFCGLHYAAGEIIITMDDDLQHPPEEIPKLIEKLNEGYEAVFGIPFVKQHPAYRKLGSELISWLLTRIAGKAKDVKTSSFRAINRRVAERILKENRSFIYLSPLIFSCTRRIAQVAVRHDPRKIGRSNYSFIKLVILAVKLIIYYAKIFKWLPHPRKPQFLIDKIWI